MSTWPLSTKTVQEAVMSIYDDSAVLVESWGDFFHSEHLRLPVPKVIALREYVHVDATPKFCRRSIYLRDRYCCQYCGERFHTSELTFDHVFPKSKGGKTAWDNVLTCCVRCNVAKRDSLIGRHKGAWRPLKMPRQPTSYELLKSGLEFLDPSLRESFGDWLYWNGELQA